MNTQKLIEVENNLLNYITGEMEVGQESASVLIKAYRDLLDVVSIRQYISFPEDKALSKEISICTSDLVRSFQDVTSKVILEECVEYKVNVIDGGGTGKVVSQYIITKLPANAETP